eukprot:4827958-Amphidinium_carterae.1
MEILKCRLPSKWMKTTRVPYQGNPINLMVTLSTAPLSEVEELEGGVGQLRGREAGHMASPLKL